MSNEKDAMRMVLENFDVDMFLNVEYDQANETSRTLMPQGWVPMRIKDFTILKPRLIAKKDKPDEKEWMSPQIKFECVVDDPGIREILNVREGVELKCFPQLYLDIDTATGLLDFGPNRNIALGQIRSALGQNSLGVHWNWSQLRNSDTFWAHVRHDVPDANKPENVYERYTRFAKEPTADTDKKAA